MGFTKYTSQKEQEKVRINEGIRAKELRVIGEDGENYGILPLPEAVKKAQELGFDLIEISPNAKPPVAKISDYGKFKYEQKKRSKDIKAKSHVTETKSAQVKIGTGERDMEIKASRIAGWLREKHRVKVDLFLWGRYKYMDSEFLKDRLERFLAIIPESFKIADEIKKSPKGLSVTIEYDKSGKRWQPSKPLKKLKEPDAEAENTEAEEKDESGEKHEDKPQ
ncbi:translation initiation factor IF-3 [Candidatus Kaiserbacteria bacterium CG10_big_fil_rev_8_21_14_0_10_43_70]|uniref:Translation initiation factor IF-3 n=1 Tax=Candidatus Kaiserbacteria bacterium CG10_big_fil_rev_8_21_14_0_10_43_70 TaxID=1974605 RepID=A0A2H0UIX2_9BACT|nr:MAG: translation initiation factor IF-3 [Candidatus Kaiserbacteria bacterium CG10_big_fil_rev_8_21_14_0_10_43_70]